MKVIKTILNWILFILTGKGPIAEEGVKEGILDYSGEGRDENGK